MEATIAEDRRTGFDGKKKDDFSDYFRTCDCVRSEWGIYLYLQKYYFFNEKNVYVQREVSDWLNELYSQEFELLSIEFETIKVDTGGSSCMHMWTFTFEDSQGRQFYVYDRISGSGKNAGLDGAFYHLDYYNKDYIDDTYGQLCMEERLGGQYDLQQYRQEKGNPLPYQPDYIFVCTENNADEIAEILTQMYFTETEFSTGCCLRCMVNNEVGEKVYSYYWGTVTNNLENQVIKITDSRHINISGRNCRMERCNRRSFRQPHI